MQQIVCNINISYQEFKAAYQSPNAYVFVNIQGKKMLLRAKYLKSFLQPFGISGKFLIVFSKSGKLYQIKKV